MPDTWQELDHFFVMVFDMPTYVLCDYLKQALLKTTVTILIVMKLWAYYSSFRNEPNIFFGYIQVECLGGLSALHSAGKRPDNGRIVYE